MSSSKNNNLPIQTLTSMSNAPDFALSRQGSSSAVNAIRSQRTQQEQAASSRRGRSGKGSRGRGKQSGYEFGNSKAAYEKSSQNFTSVPENPTTEDGPSSAQMDATCSSSTPGRVIGYKPSGSRGGHGKYRQRQQTNQLLEGMSNLDGLGIDLAEGIVPTVSAGKAVETGRGRHATNSRKMNLTHLLNYKFERQQRKGRFQQSSSSGDSGVGLYHRNPLFQYRNAGTMHKFSKQQFLQANCQFVVLNGHDYTVHKADPDWPVDWECIEEVRFKQSASTETTCPVCLEPPVAAKITRCGHIYCWTCMLHYLSLSDESCRQCPICFEPVYKGDLRSVVSHSFINHSVDENIIMKLMVRKKGCVEVEPYHVEPQIPPVKSINEQRHDEDNDHYWSQANLVIVDADTVISKIAQRERVELQAKLHLDKDEPEVCFIEQALAWLDKRVEKLNQRTSIDNASNSQEIRNLEKRVSPLGSSNDSAKSYLFYQCADGQHIYLNPFSTKILCHEFNKLESCPLEIQAKILQMDWISMSEAWRKRFRYLEHLPLTCEFRLIEIDFEKSNLISEGTYNVYEEQIKKREQERERRRREERKREKIIQVEQNRRIYGIQPSLRISLNNIDQFPSVSDERYLGLSMPKNHSRSNEDYLSDDEEVVEPHSSATGSTCHDLSETINTNIAIDSDSSTDVISNIALSFNEIQLQEAAKVAKSAKGNSKSAAWTSKNQDQTNTQCSFAQLLVNAKTSQKEWTRNNSSTAAGTNSSSLPGGVPSSGPSYRQHLTSVSDDGGEEFRAPPGEFTISDFIDMNVVSSNGKKRSKLKSVPKKG